MSRPSKVFPWLIESLAVETDACIDWPFALASGRGSYAGTPAMRWEGRNTRATHVVLALTGRPLPKGHEVRHTCNNSRCVNQRHLTSGTHRENIDDRLGHSSLSVEAIHEIRAAPSRYGLHSELGRRFRVSRTTILNVRTGKRWSHV